MSYEATRAVISKYITDNLTGITLVPENHPFEPSTAQVWARFGVHPSDQFAPEIGGKWERVIGNIWFQVFLPENSGSKEADEVADTIKAVFFQKNIVTAGKPTVTTQSVILRYIGQEPSGRQLWSVTVPYRVTAPVT